mmetsp:Transcript_9794/g.27347  ORF Transcript_9794/g.27347 Transcript_9794/m.27347 type:complete len:726 (-) Transcript_9794:90-2267(-)
MLKLSLVSALWWSLESVRLQEAGVDEGQTPDKLEEQRVQLDLVVADRQSRVDTLVKHREAFEKEMSDKLQGNRAKDKAGKEEEASRFHIIKNAQEEREKVKLEIASLTQKIAKDDFQRQRKISEFNDVLQNMQIHVDGAERPVLAKRSEEEALQQMIDEASEERSGIDAAITANMQLEDVARAEEVSSKQRVTDLQAKRETLAASQASTSEKLRVRTKDQLDLTEHLALLADVKKTLDSAKAASEKELAVAAAKAKDLAKKLVDAASEDERLKAAHAEKAKLLKEAATQKLHLDVKVTEEERDSRWKTTAAQQKERLVHTQAREKTVLEAALVRSKREVAESKREQVSKATLAREKREVLRVVEDKIENLKADRNDILSEGDHRQVESQRDEEALEKQRAELDREIQMLDMQTATQGKLAQAKDEEQMMLETQVHELGKKVQAVQGELRDSQESSQAQANTVAETGSLAADVEANISKLKMEESEIVSGRQAVAAEMILLIEQMSNLTQAEERLRRVIKDYGVRQVTLAAEEETQKQILVVMSAELADIHSAFEQVEGEDAKSNQWLESLPQQISEAQSQQSELQSNIDALNTNQSLKTAQLNALQEQLASTSREKNRLATVEFDQGRPLRQKTLERQALLDIMGGTPAEKAKLRDLHARVAALNLQEKNSKTVIATIHRLSEDRARKVDESKDRFHKSFAQNEQNAMDRLEKARANRAQMDEAA